MSPPHAHAHPLPPTELLPAPLGEAPEHLEPTPAQAPSRALGGAAAMGFLLMSGQSILTRVLSFGSQIVLARLLTEEQFGLFGLATSIVSYANLAQQVGVREILVSRQKRIALWSNAGFWIAILTGAISTLLILGAAPIAGWVYNDRMLVWMLLILGAAQPAYSMTLVHEAKLQINLRFRYLALCQFIWGALQPLLQLVFALANFGALTFVLPRLVAGGVRWWMFTRAEKVTVLRDPQLRRWKYILSPGIMLLFTGLAYTLGPSVPTLMLGRVAGTASAGHFTFAYNLSLQALMLLSMQIDNVLFPTLGKMEGEPERQRSALVRAARALAAVMAPICLFQIAAARPLVMLVFGAKWEPSIVGLQIMSVGMLGAGAFVPAQSLLQAQGRFKAKLFIALFWALISAATSICGILIAPKEHAVAAASAGLALGYFGYGFHNCVAATRPLGGGISDAVRVIVMPSVVGMLATGAAWWSSTLVPVYPNRMWLTFALQIGTIGTIGAIAYPLLLRMLAPALWADLVQAGEPVLRRLRQVWPGKSSPSRN